MLWLFRIALAQGKRRGEFGLVGSSSIGCKGVLRLARHVPTTAELATVYSNGHKFLAPLFGLIKSSESRLLVWIAFFVAVHF